MELHLKLSRPEPGRYVCWRGGEVEGLKVEIGVI